MPDAQKSRRTRAARQRFRRLTRETLESCCLLALASGENSPWFNFNSGMDVDGDGYVPPADALIIANLINAVASFLNEQGLFDGEGSGFGSGQGSGAG